jgi:hypothetical protein
MRPTRNLRLCVVLATLTLAPSLSSPAPAEVVINATAVEPHVFHAVTGQRVDFVKRVDAPAHVEFGEQPSQHHVYQLSATGSIWAVFHRPGTHPYVVHIYSGKTTTALHGIIEVSEDPQRPWERGTCGAVVMEDCVEP